MMKMNFIVSYEIIRNELENMIQTPVILSVLISLHYNVVIYTVSYFSGLVWKKLFLVGMFT